MKKVMYLAIPLLILVGLPKIAPAASSYQLAFNKLYAIKAGSALSKCTVCHTAAIPALNPYGKAYALKHRGAVTVVLALKRIQALDSDKDGFTNLAEIKAGKLPGKATSKPAAMVFSKPVWPKAAEPTLPDFTTDFRINECEFSSRGSNDFFILEPGFEASFEGTEGGVFTELTITVTEETKMVGDVKTRVVQEVHKEDGQIVETTRNYFAICKETNMVFYFGEDADIFDPATGQVVSHEGSWLAGVNDAKAGVIMPGFILLGSRYFQEIAPDVAMDRAEIVSMNEVVQTSVGEFKDCVKTEETTPLDPTLVENKWYAPGVGLVKDGDLGLVKYTPAKD